MAKKRKPAENPQLAKLQSELYQTHDALDCAFVRFNNADDPELIESCIFTICALQAKYNYLLRCVKILSGQPISYGSIMKARPAEPVPNNAVAADNLKGGNLCHW